MHRILLASSLLATPAAAIAQTWQAEQILANPAAGAAHIAVAVNAAGLGVAVWDETDSTGLTTVRAATHDATGWKAIQTLSPPGIPATNGGAVVTPAGAISVFLTAAGTAYEAASTDAGLNFTAAAVPADPGFTGIAGAGADAVGDVQLALYTIRAAKPFAVDTESLVKAPGGTWSAPATISTGGNGGTRLRMNAAGQAVLLGALGSYYASAPNAWGPLRPFTLTGGQVFSTDIALGPAGTAYFLYRSHYGGVNISVSANGGAWSKPRHITKLDGLFSPIRLAAGAPGQVVAYGIDWSVGSARTSLSVDAGRSFGPLAVPGGGTGAHATDLSVIGNDLGTFAASWYDTNGRLRIATGNPAGQSIAWAAQPVAANYPTATVAIAGTQLLAAWVRGADPLYTAIIVGARAANLAP